MSKVIQVRDVPDRVHAALVEAAEAHGPSLTIVIRRWSATPLPPRLWELHHDLSGFDGRLRPSRVARTRW